MAESLPMSKEPKPAVEIHEGQPTGNGLLDDISTFWSVAKRFRLLFAIVFIVVASLSFWYFNYYATYSATEKFLISDWSQPFPSSTNNNPVYNQDRVNQMLMLFLSDSVIQFVIDKYHLGAGLRNPQSSNELLALRSNVAQWITLRQSAFNSYDLVVTTPDRFLSANIANDISNQVAKISRGMYEHDLSTRIEVLTKLLTTVSMTQSDSASDDLLANRFRIIEEQLSRLAAGRFSTDELKPILNEIDQLQSQYNDRRLQLRINEMMLQQVSSNANSSVTIIQRAMPDFSNYVFYRLLWSLLIALFICALLPFMIYVYYRLSDRNIILLDSNSLKR